MRNWNQYLKLWQQKRNELYIGNDMQADWSDMHHLLDEHMPINSNAGNGGNAGNSSSDNLGMSAKLLHLTKFKLLYIAAGLIISGIVTYLTVNHKADTKVDKQLKQEKINNKKDSILNNNAQKTDSLQNIMDDISPDRSGDKNSPAIQSSANLSSIDHNNTTKLSNDNKTDLKRISTRTNNVKASADKPDGGSPSKNNSVSRDFTGRDHLSTYSTGINNGATSFGNNTRRSANRRQRKNDRSAYIGNQGRLWSDNRLQSNRYSAASNNQDKDPVDSRSIIDFPLAQSTLTWEDIVAESSKQPAAILTNLPVKPSRKLSTVPKAKTQRSLGNSYFDLGLLAGVDGKGSFSYREQNHNIYGSLPVDIYVGAFSTYNFNDRWAVGLQGRFLTPHNVGSSYKYVKTTVKGNGADSTNIIQIKDSRRIYTVDIPLYLIYKPTGFINLKAGPKLSIPVKTYRRSGTFEVDTIAFYNLANDAVNNTRFEKKIHYGISAGAGFSYKFLWLDATYNYNFRPQNISSDLGGYTPNINSLQITLGITLNKRKK